MPRYLYHVRDKFGKLSIGVLEAEDKVALRNSFSKAGYLVVKVVPYKEKRALFKKRPSLESLIIFTQQLSATLSAGIPLLSSLEAVWRQSEDKGFQMVISQVRNLIGQGNSFSASLSHFKDIFPPIYIEMVELGEKGVGMDTSLLRLSRYLSQQRDFVSKIKKIATYPLIVLSFAILVVIGMITFLIPVYKRFFIRLQVDLPAITRFLLLISDLIKKYWWLGLLVFAGIVFLYKRYVSTKDGRYRVDRFKLGLPLLGRLIYKVAMARFVRCFGFLVASGMPISQSIRSSKKVFGNLVLENGLDLAEEKIIKEGRTINRAFDETRLFPATVLQMISAGEESGSLAEMLDKSANFLEEDLDYGLSKFLSLMEPLLIIIVGLMVAIILLSMYLPIFSLWNKMAR